MKVIAPVARTPTEAGSFTGEGFEVTERSLKQLRRVSVLSDEIVKYARQQLSAETGIRSEIFAQGGGRFQVVLQVDWSKSE